MTTERPAPRWPRVRRAFVAARRDVLEGLRTSPGRPAPLAAIGERLGLPVRLLGIEAPPEAEDVAGGGGWCLHLRDERGADVRLRVEDRLAAALVADVLGADSWALPAGDGGEAMAGVLTVQALRGLAALAAAGRPIELVDLYRAGPASAGSDGAIALSLRLLVGDCVGRATVRVVPRESPPRRTGLPGWVAALPLEGALVLARGRIPRGELRALRPGDAVVLDDVPSSGAGDEERETKNEERAAGAWLAAGGMLWPCRADGEGRWTIGGPPRGRGAGRSGMTTEDSDRTEVIAGAEAGAAIDEVPIEVTAVAGRVPLTVGALTALEVGAVVGLGRSPAGSIELLANGVPIARGRLIDLEGELAVEVTELRAGPATGPAR